MSPSEALRTGKPSPKCRRPAGRPVVFRQPTVRLRLNSKSTDAPQQNRYQLLIQIFVECAVIDGFFYKERLIHLQYLLLAGTIRFGIGQ